MKKIFKSLAVCLIIVFGCFLAACSKNNNSNSGGGSSSTSSNSNNEISISTSNAGQFFDIDVSIYDTYGQLVYYKLTIRLIGNYKLSTNIDFTVKSEITYYYNTAYSGASGTSKDTESFTMQKGTNSITKKCTGSIPRNVSECNNIKISSLIYSASGKIASN